MRYRFAVNRTFKREGDPDADFFNIVMFGNPAERFEKLNIQKGTKLMIEGDIRNNNYTDKDGVKHYDINFVANVFEFLEKKADSPAGTRTAQPQVVTPSYQAATPSYGTDDDGFMFIPDDASDEGLPWV